MESPNKIGFFQGHRAVLIELRAFVDATVRPICDRRFDRSDVHHQVHLTALSRAQAWLHTLAELDSPYHLQAMEAGARALFELAVDTTLLRFEPESAPSKLLAWERSAKLKSSERAVRFYEGSELPDPIFWRKAFIEREGDTISEERGEHWGKRGHPQRWTGRSLAQDAVQADKPRSQGFEESYATIYAQRCWNTHGSAGAAIRTMSKDNIAAMAGFALADAIRCATIVARNTMELLDWLDSIGEERFRELEDRRALLLHSHMFER